MAIAIAGLTADARIYSHLVKDYCVNLWEQNVFLTNIHMNHNTQLEDLSLKLLKVLISSNNRIITQNIKWSWKTIWSWSISCRNWSKWSSFIWNMPIWKLLWIQMLSNWIKIIGGKNIFRELVPFIWKKYTWITCLTWIKCNQKSYNGRWRVFMTIK
jgi:hypothetical protein